MAKMLLGTSPAVPRSDRDAPVEIRPLSLLERYFHVPVITRSAHTITYLFRYPSSSLLSADRLRARVTDIQKTVHHLWAEVVDGETPYPFLQLRPRGPWPPDAIVREDTYAAMSSTDGKAKELGQDEEAEHAELEARLMAKEIERMRIRVADGGPAWQVTRYHPDALLPTKDPSYIAVSMYHHLLDGTGGLRLSLFLLSDYPISSSPGLAPRMEDVIDLSPSLRFLATEVIKELVIPILPSTFRALVSPEPCWPGDKLKGHPIDFPEAQLALHLPASWIPALKRAGAARGISTLYPIFEATFVLALHAIMGSPEMTIKVGTPVNERDPSDAGHPSIGTNFHSLVRTSHFHLDLPLKHSFSDEKDISDAPHSPTLWSVAQSTASHLASAQARRHGRYDIGMLAYIPNPTTFSSPHADNPHRRTKTGWEDFFWTCAERPAPFRGSMVVSNLGRVQKLPAGCTGMRWSQTSSPFEEPLMVGVIGHDLGLEISVAFRDGCVVSRDEVERVLQRFEAMLGGLI